MKLKYDELPSNFAFQNNLRRYIKDLTDKFQSELDGDKTKFELLLQEKNEQEMEYEEKLKQSEVVRCSLNPRNPC